MEYEHIDDFLESLRIQGYTNTTIAQYHTALHGLCAYLVTNDIHSMFAVHEETIHAWRAYLECHGCNRLTALKKLLRVYRFFAWLHKRGYLLVNPLQKPSFHGVTSLPRRIPARGMVRKAFCTLRESVRVSEQRDYITLDLGYSCGLRRCELHGLDIQDINTEDSTIRVRGKGSKERVVPVGQHTMRDLLHYVYHVRPKLVTTGSTSALLVSWQKGGTRMNMRSINRAFIRNRIKYGLGNDFTPHGLRHAFATDLVKNGAPVQDVAEMLGHTKLETTQVYTHLTAIDLKKNHKKYHPRG